MKNSIALFVVFYPGIELFIEDFFNSVINQSCKDFDLIIVNDGWKCKNLANQYQNLHIVELPGGNSIAKNREIGINYVIKQKYRYLLLCDADDTFHPQRVESSIRALQKYDIVVNDVNIVSVDGQVMVSDYFCKSLKGNEVLDMDFILKKNSLDDRAYDVEHEESRMIMDGHDLATVHNEIGKKRAALADEMNTLAKEFIQQNYDNVLGPGVFLMLFNGMPYPILTPMMEEIVSKAPESFMNDPLVKEYVAVARSNMEKMKHHP